MPLKLSVPCPKNYNPEPTQVTVDEDLIEMEYGAESFNMGRERARTIWPILKHFAETGSLPLRVPIED